MVTVRFGNLTTSQFENKTGVYFKEEDREWLVNHRTNTADIKGNGVFHIFDLPLGIVASADIFPELVKRLRKYNFNTRFYVEQKEADTEPAS